MTPDELAHEIERLHSENAALNEQVKLLVQTARRLYRSQNELDAQLHRIRALAGFTLGGIGTATSGAILLILLLGRGR